MVLFQCMVLFLCYVTTEFVKLWRTVAVDGIDDKTIEDYLQKQGIASMEHVGLRRIVSNFIRHLITYDSFS